MRVRPALPIAVLAAALALGGCVAQDGFPSLAPRAAELDRSMEPPVRPPVEIADDPALRNRVAELARQAEAGSRAFDAAYGPAEAAVRAAGAALSESWVDAQLRLSQLEGSRNDTTRALGDLDRLALDRAGQPTSEADFAAIQAAIASAERIVADQQARVDRLRARLPAV